MGKTLDFDYYLRENICTSVHVDYSTQTVEVVNYTDDIIDQAFGLEEVTIDSIDEFFRERVFPETRVNCKKILNRLGMQHFDAEAIARITHGSMFEDGYWVKFSDDDEMVNWDLVQECMKVHI